MKGVEKMAVALSNPVNCGSIERYVSLMKKHPLFEGISDEEISRISQGFDFIVIPKDNFIVSKGDKADYVIFLAQGKVKYLKRHYEVNKEKIIWILSAPEVLGLEAATSKEGIYNFDIVSLTQVTIIKIPWKLFKEVFDSDPHLRENLYHFLSEKINNLMDDMANMTFYNITERLVILLYNILSEELGSSMETYEGEYELPRELSLQDIASIIGSVREVVARAMASLERGKVLRRTRKKLYINVPKLRERYYTYTLYNRAS